MPCGSVMHVLGSASPSQLHLRDVIPSILLVRKLYFQLEVHFLAWTLSQQGIGYVLRYIINVYIFSNQEENYNLSPICFVLPVPNLTLSLISHVASFTAVFIIYPHETLSVTHKTLDSIIMSNVWEHFHLLFVYMSFVHCLA